MNLRTDPNVNACFLTASELYHEEYGEEEFSTLEELFIRKPIENEELIEKIKQLTSQ